MGARKGKGSKSWSVPFPMADTPGIPDCNPVLFLNGGGKLFLFWIAVLADGWENSILRYRTSEEYSNSGPPVWNWQDNIFFKPTDRFAEEVEKRFEELPESGLGWAEYAPPYDEMVIEASKDLMKRSIGWMTRIHPLTLENGRILLPLYSDGFNFSLVAISDDDGDTWSPSLPIVGRGPIQPALAQRKNGDIVALMRDSGDEPARVHYSVSHDQGESWTATVKTDIPNTASVELLELQDGSWAFFGNPINDGRYRLEFWLSHDEGHTWSSKKVVEEVEKGKGGFSYPSMIQTGDGLVHITYSYDLGRGNKSIKHVVLDPEEVR
jgi:hypothetical protein